MCLGAALFKQVLFPLNKKSTPAISLAVGALRRAVVGASVQKAPGRGDPEFLSPVLKTTIVPGGDARFQKYRINLPDFVQSKESLARSLLSPPCAIARICLLSWLCCPKGGLGLLEPLQETTKRSSGVGSNVCCGPDSLSYLIFSYLRQASRYPPDSDRLWLLLTQAVFRPWTAGQRPFSSPLWPPTNPLPFSCPDLRQSCSRRSLPRGRGTILRQWSVSIKKYPVDFSFSELVVWAKNSLIAYRSNLADWAPPEEA